MLSDVTAAVTALMDEYGVDAVIETLTELVASSCSEDLARLEALLAAALAVRESRRGPPN